MLVSPGFPDKTPRMRLLVTGGCGFIGSNFIRYILEHYDPEFVTNVDALTYAGNIANVQGWRRSMERGTSFCERTSPMGTLWTSGCGSISSLRLSISRQSRTWTGA